MEAEADSAKHPQVHAPSPDNFEFFWSRQHWDAISREMFREFLWQQTLEWARELVAEQRAKQTTNPPWALDLLSEDPTP